MMATASEGEIGREAEVINFVSSFETFSHIPAAGSSFHLCALLSRRTELVGGVSVAF